MNYLIKIDPNNPRYYQLVERVVGNHYNLFNDQKALMVWTRPPGVSENDIDWKWGLHTMLENFS